MFRTLVYASMVFLWGSPQFESMRPEALDVPLVRFHVEVKDIARDAVAALESVDDVRRLRFMDEYFEFITGRLSG